MEILEAFDLTGSLRGAAELAGCDHKTVAHWVAARDAAGGGLALASRPRPARGEFEAKVAELVERSRGKVRADKAHEKLVAMGYLGSERTTRRPVAEAKRRYRQEHGRLTRPWTPEPGLWMQWDYGDGPEVAGRSTILFCAWLAWSRFRVVLPLWDKTMPSVVMALDRALRRFGSVPTYALTDNERTVSIDQVCGIAVRNPQIVSVGRHYGRRSPRVCRQTRRAREARKRPFGSPRRIWSRPITTSGPGMGRSPSSRLNVSGSASGSTRASTGSRAGRRR
jgi:hypothetical protein